MSNLKTGAFLSSFKLGFEESLKIASEIGLDGIEFADIKGEIDVANIPNPQYILEMFEKYNLQITSVCAEMGGFSVSDKQIALSRVERCKKVMDNAKALNCNIVQLHIGHVPETQDENYYNLRQSLKEVGRYAKEIDCYIASETGPEPGHVLRDFLISLDEPYIKVNFDPANLVMWGFDEIDAVVALKDYIIHTHAKDGMRASLPQKVDEVPLGMGDVRFDEYVKLLNEIGYNGYYVIEREVGPNPADDIKYAKEFLERY